MEKMNKNDALGNPIKIGNTYGYTTDNSGYTTVTLGKAKNFTPTGRVSLNVIHTETRLRGHELIDNNNWNTAKIVSIQSMKLFPVNLDKK